MGGEIEGIKGTVKNGDRAVPLGNADKGEFVDCTDGHLEFHLYGHNSDAIWHVEEEFNTKSDKNGEKERISIGATCRKAVTRTKVEPYTMMKDGNQIPYVYYETQGRKGHCPASGLALRLKGFEIPHSHKETAELTNALVDSATTQGAYEESGYILHLSGKTKTDRKKRIREEMDGRTSEEEQTES